MRKTSPERLSNSPNITQLSNWATQSSFRTQWFPWHPWQCDPHPESCKGSIFSSQIHTMRYFTSTRVNPLLQVYSGLKIKVARFENTGLRKNPWAPTANWQQAGAFRIRGSQKRPACHSSRQTEAAKLSHDVRQALNQSQRTPPPWSY